MKDKTRLILIIIFAAVFSFSVTFLIIHAVRNANDAGLYANISDQFLQETISSNNIDVFVPNGVTESESGDLQLNNTQDSISVPPLAVDFAGLNALNPEVCGWIYSSNNIINYPLLKTTDNSKYVTKDIRNKHSKAGAIFLDCRNNTDYSDRNTIIYGHNLNTDAMFGSLMNYKDQEYYDKYKDIYIYTKDITYVYRIFSVRIVDSDDITYSLKVADDTDYSDYLSMLLEESIIDSEITPTAINEIISLSTCTNVNAAQRLIVYAVQIGSTKSAEFVPVETDTSAHSSGTLTSAHDWSENNTYMGGNNVPVFDPSSYVTTREDDTKTSEDTSSTETDTDTDTDTDTSTETDTGSSTDTSSETDTSTETDTSSETDTSTSTTTSTESEPASTDSATTSTTPDSTGSGS